MSLVIVIMIVMITIMVIGHWPVAAKEDHEPDIIMIIMIRIVIMMVVIIRSVLDYAIQIRMLPDKNKNYMALTGNYSVAGFELTLRRKVIAVLKS